MGSRGRVSVGGPVSVTVTAVALLCCVALASGVAMLSAAAAPSEVEDPAVVRESIEAFADLLTATYLSDGDEAAALAAVEDATASHPAADREQARFAEELVGRLRDTFGESGLLIEDARVEVTVEDLHASGHDVVATVVVTTTVDWTNGSDGFPDQSGWSDTQRWTLAPEGASFRVVSMAYVLPEAESPRWWEPAPPTPGRPSASDRPSE